MPTKDNGNDRLVEELIFKFTHTNETDWILPGIPPTGKRIEVPMVVIAQFKEGKMAYERIYWDQASVLVQIGMLNPKTLPIVGIEGAQKFADITSPSKP